MREREFCGVFSIIATYKKGKYGI